MNAEDLHRLVERMKRRAAQRRQELEREEAARQADPNWQRQARAAILAAIGFGPRYQYPDPARVPAELAAALREYTAHIDEYIPQGLGCWLGGDIGVGKTMALALLCLAAWEKGYVPLYRSAPQLFNELARSEPGELQPLRQCDLLAIDDLGTEYSSDWAMARFHELVEYRYAHLKALAITSNFPPAELRPLEQWARIVDRWAQCIAVARWQPGKSQRR
jgi:DNA replication protein DnaC